jgi:hypothetical protein
MQRIFIELFPLYSGKCLPCKAVHNLVEKFSQGRSKVEDDAWPGRPVEILAEATVQQMEELIRADRRMDNYRQCSNCTRLFPCLAYSIMHDQLKFWKYAHGGCPDNWRTEKKLTESVCPCNISYGMQMKEKTCLTEILLGMYHRCITTNKNHSVLQCDGNSLVHLLVQPKSLRLCHQMGRLYLPCFGILREYC